MTGEEVARELISVLSTKYDVTSELLVAAMRDRASGAGHTMAETTATVTFMVMAKNVVNWSHTIILFSEQREDGIYRVVVDLSVLAASALRCPWTSQESSSQQFVCCSSPAGFAQESSCTVALATPVRVGSSPIPGRSALHSSPTPFMGSTKAARLVGETCASSGEVWGGTILTGRTASTCSTFACRRIRFGSFPDIWQVFQERRHSSEAYNTCCQEISHCPTLAILCVLLHCMPLVNQQLYLLCTKA